MARRRTRGEPATDAERVLTTEEASLLDIVDNVLNKGVVLTGDVTIALAHVDLIYARLSLLLCAADRILPNEETDFMQRHHRRHELREIRARQRARASNPEPRRVASESSPNSESRVPTAAPRARRK